MMKFSEHIWIKSSIEMILHSSTTRKHLCSEFQSHDKDLLLVGQTESSAMLGKTLYALVLLMEKQDQRRFT